MTSWAHARRNHFGRHAMPGMWMIAGASRLIGRSRPGVIHAGLAACNAYKGAPEAAAKVACPTLLILGSEDMMTPAKGGRELAGMIPGARAETIEGSGHMMTIEAPSRTLELMRGNV
jgi:pimeloyl-ACP methyl ester carboxylesterase